MKSLRIEISFQTVSTALALGLLTHCAATHPKVTTSANETSPARYLAWEGGDVQTDYQPDRQLADARLSQWEGQVPDVSDTANYLQYVSVLDATGHSSDAEAKLKKFLAVNPGEKRAIFLLGVHFMRRGKHDLANYFFSQLEKDESFEWKSLLYNNLAMLALQERNRLLAVSYLEKAVKADPPTSAPLVNLGALYLQSRSYADAEKLFTRALELDGDFEDAVLGRGSCLEGMGKFDEAHKLYADFITTHPDSLSVLYNDSIILGNRLKQRDAAAQQMLRYIQRGGKEMAKAHDIIQGWR